MEIQLFGLAPAWVDVSGKECRTQILPSIFSPSFFWGCKFFFSGEVDSKIGINAKYPHFPGRRKKSMNFNCKLCMFLCLVVFHSAPLSSQAFQSSRGSFNTSSSATKQTSKIKRTQKNMFFLSGVFRFCVCVFVFVPCPCEELFASIPL